MIITIDSSKLMNQDVDLICTYCGREHSIKDSIEGEDYIFERDTISLEEWCICKECKEEYDKK